MLGKGSPHTSIGFYTTHWLLQEQSRVYACAAPCSRCAIRYKWPNGSLCVAAEVCKLVAYYCFIYAGVLHRTAAFLLGINPGMLAVPSVCLSHIL